MPEFRGKSVDNGDWYFGSLIQDFSSQTAGICIYAEIPKQEVFLANLECNVYRVDLKTVGQCIRIRDKNGKRIFEGDILRSARHIYTVDWYDDCACYVLSCIGNPELDTDFGVLYGHKLEIIGNIHDNPELIGGKNQ